MSKLVLGLVLGAILGLIDGASAYLYPYPDVREQIVSIVIGSTFKGLLTGLAAGWVALKTRSLAIGILVGVVVGFALSYAVAAAQGKYYWEIVPPGTALGAVVGFCTQRFGRARSTPATS